MHIVRDKFFSVAKGSNYAGGTRISILKGTKMSSLASVKNKITGDGQSFPELALADGTKVQTGTVSALLHNIRLYDALPEDATVEREELEKNLE